MGFFKNLVSKVFWKTILPVTGDWKTKLGAFILSAGLFLENFPGLFAGQEAVAKLLISIGTALGGVGVADKMNKLIDAAKSK